MVKRISLALAVILFTSIYIQTADLNAGPERSTAKSTAKSPEQTAGYWYRAGSALQDYEKYDAALRAFEIALKHDPSHFDSLMGKVSMLSSKYKFEDALVASKLVTKAYPDSLIAWAQVAGLYIWTREKEKAIETIEQYIQKHPNNAEAWVHKGSLLSILNRKEAALSAFDKASSLGAINQDGYFVIMSAYEWLKMYPEALKTVNELLKLHPKEAYFWLKKGEFLARLNYKSAAERAFERALYKSIKLKSDDRYMFLTFIADGYLLLKNDERALEVFDSALKISPEDYYTLAYNGRWFEKMGRHEEALSYFNKMLEIEPDSVGSWKSKGNALLELERYEEALQAFEKVIALRPDCGYDILKKAETLEALGRHEEAKLARDEADALGE